jgi:uncharacterized membrane protein
VNSERAFEWQLGGWLALPPGVCWALLGLLAVGGIALMVWLYRHTLRALTWRQRVIFVALRGGFFLVLLICLAGPAQVERVYNSTQDSRPLAVLVDRSQSMIVQDARGVTRLSTALRAWKKVEADAIHAFPSLRYFRFGESADAASDLESAVNGAEPGTSTHLYGSLNQLMKEAPSGGYGGIVCLTDGLDTTDATPDESVSRALQNHCPLYFCVGQGQSAPALRETLLVREVDMPGQVLRKSQFTARIVVEAHTAKARDVPLSLWVDNQSAAQTEVHLHVGANLIPWTIPVDSAEPGLLHVECRLGEGAEAETIAAAVRVVAQEQIHILFYQGSLDWSYRFINLAVQNDASFALTGLFNPDLSMTREITSSSQDPNLTQMPEKAEDLKPFQIVVLSNVFADQMSAAQQTALIDYVQGGGGVLFMVSDTKMAATFAGTAIEGMMPVIFEAPVKEDQGAQAEDVLQDQMNQTGVAYEAEGETKVDPLQHFAFPPNPKRSEVADLFGAASGGLLQNLPEFSTYARVRGIKAGGEVLAVHPLDKTADNVPRALLVTQRYGQGHVTALLTDGLWRWKLSLPSESRDPEVFWQQLLRILARHETAHGNLHFGLQPFFSSLGQVSDFRLEGAEGPNAPKVSALSPGGVALPLAVQLDPQANTWSFQLKPDQPGKWRIQAEDGRGAQMETLLRVSSTSHGDELSGQPADTEGLRKLAVSTGGCLLDNGASDNWSASGAAQSATLVSKRSQPLWDQWAVLLIGLGLYATELVWRRRAKLL